MNRYFWAANAWTFITFLLIVGRSYERQEPTMCSVFHLGQWFSPGEYSVLVLSVVFVSVFLWFMTLKTRDRQ